MAAPLDTIDIRTRPEWRAWLQEHHASSPGVWLVFFKRHTKVASLSYEDAVREALCFGWVDSLIRRLDDRRYAFKMTPRTPRSQWSPSNMKRWADLRANGLLAPPGLAAAPTPNASAPKPSVPRLPGYIGKAIKANGKAALFFRSLPSGERRQFVVWVHVAKRPETRERRLREAVRLLAAGRRLGLK